MEVLVSSNQIEAEIIGIIVSIRKVLLLALAQCSGFALLPDFELFTVVVHMKRYLNRDLQVPAELPLRSTWRHSSGTTA